MIDDSFLSRRGFAQQMLTMTSITTCSLLPAQLFAQLRVEVSGIGASQIPIGIAVFKGEEQLQQKVSSIVSSDLMRSGLFRPVAVGQNSTQPIDEATRPDWVRLRALGADSLLAGSVTRLADGRLDVRCRLWDSVRAIELGALSVAVPAQELRLTAHRLADWVYEKLTSERGVAATRIAYVTKTTQNGTARFNLWVADADGENASPALTSTEPIISPAWSPNGQQLAYVSFESRKPVVYVHELVSSKRRAVANFKGSNSAPAWSPDGQYLAVTLSRDGGSQIFLVPVTGNTEPKRISTSNSVDTEAVFAPDGQSLYFVSDRGGNPQIYKMALSGGAAQRLTFTGNYNISPAISPDGTKLAFIARVGGAFKLSLQDLNSGIVSTISDASADESPSFSANGKQIIYATQSNVSGRWQEALMTSTLDGRVKSKLSVATGDIREPHWGPYFGASFK